MSKRNSQEAKRQARERLRVERERQAKKDRIRRQLIVGGSVVAVLALVTGIGVAVANMGDDKETSDKDLAVTTGGAKAKKTIDVYEDLRCPACAQFEQSIGHTLQEGADDGKYKLRIHLGTIIDDNMGGKGSRNAASALGAAKAVSTKAFTEYKEKLFSKEFHPQEQDDKFADNKYLLKVSDEVPALKDNKKFEKAVNSDKYGGWAKEMIASFNGAGVKGTPTVRVDGEDIDTAELPNKLKELGVDVK
ncbi:thioredoxin domain-containing protein [Streptomyces boncukensis]|uniref:Thioredoxin domain-containing protein n=1 Tax=Streptomyces boncukensis TaxID=2711219 RepID=A0A6G4X183_9ACTN|nr:thioredoxin domain-containing protein [Streptomyces boncukensis]NGO70617.1 thioredoxin domain-containing protein [Streptomyces boncukensis]